MIKAYSLRDFTQKEIKRAKSFVATGVQGMVTASIDQQVHEFFDQLDGRYFTDADTFNFDFRFTCSGNALVAALGAAKRMTK